MNNIKLASIRLLTLLIIALSSMSTHAQAADMDCRKFAKLPTVDIIKGSTAIKKDYTKTRQNLTSREKSFSIKGFSETLGLTTLDYQVRLEYSIQTLTNKRYNLECHWFDKINIHITADQTVYVASEFTTDLCMKNEIEHHEMKHVAINRTFIKDINNILKREVQLHTRYNALVKAQPIEKGKYVQDLMGKMLTEHINEIKEKHLEQNLKAQALVDTPAEYKKVSRACD